MSAEESMESSAIKKIIGTLILIVIVGLVVSMIVYVIKPWRHKKLVKETGTTSQYKQEVRMLADSFSGYCISRSPKMQEELEKDSIKLNIIDDKADYLSRIKALKNGEADIAVFTIDSEIVSAIEELGGEFPATIVMVIDETKGADAVVAYKSAIKNIDDLNRSDARIILTPKSPSEFLARTLVFGFNLLNLPKNWIIEANGAEEVYKMLKKASKTEPKAFVLWEPWVSRALKDPDVHAIYGSDKTKGYVVDVLVARREFSREKPELVKAVVKSYLRAAYFYKDSMVDLVLEDSKLTGERISKEDANNIVKGIQWKNTLENYAHFGLLERQEAKGLENLENIITKITKVLVDTGAISSSSAKNIQPNTLFYDGIMVELQKENFHPGKKLDFLETTAKLDEVRGDVELPELTDEQWNQLVPVGQMKIEPVEFRRGTSDLNMQSKRDLDELSSKLSSMPLYYLLVIGNARAEGDIEANKLLAESRAKTVAEYLINLGVSKNRIRAIAAVPSSKGAEAQSVSFQLGQRPY